MGVGNVGRHYLALVGFCLVLFVVPTLTEIHRARSVQTFKHRFRKSDTDGKPAISEWTNWFEGKVWGHPRRVWTYSAISAGLVGLTGLFPLLVIPVDYGTELKSKASRGRLQMLLSFAVGGLLGDVFLHLLPEAWIHIDEANGNISGYRYIGGWVLAGLLSFYLIEKLFGDKGDDDDEEEEEDDVVAKAEDDVEILSNNVDETFSTSSDDSFDGNVPHGFARSIQRERSGQRSCIEKMGKKTRKRNIQKSDITKYDDVISPLPPQSQPSPPPSDHHLSSSVSSSSSSRLINETTLKSPEKKEHIKVSGWLNLLANVVDNFTHGLAVAGSYSISSKMGLLTTMAILLHEIPHEIGDFAILLQAGFDRWKAARVQVLTATGGIVGAMMALSAESAKLLGDSTAWILPFTAGGFINIALIAIVPDLLKEKNAKNSMKQLLLIFTGILIMGLVTTLVD